MKQDGKVYYPRGVPVFYTSDLHLSHSNIMLHCGRREFMSPAEREMFDTWDGQRHHRPRIGQESVSRMNEALIANINAIVPKDAVLALLGDFIWGPENLDDYYALAKYFRDAINCQSIHMVWGNHDLRHIAPLFQWHNEKVTVVINGRKVVLSHEFVCYWDCRHRGSRHYYGHTHGRAEAELEKLFPGRYSQDVGVDCAFAITGQYRPFSDRELEEKMKRRSGFGLLHKE